MTDHDTLWDEHRFRSDSYVWPDDPLSIRVARRRFLFTVHAVEPEVLADLSRAPFEVFCRVADILHPPHSGPVYRTYKLPCPEELATGEPCSKELCTEPPCMRIPSLIEEYATRDPRLQPLSTALIAWGRRWNLTDAWCLDTAMQTMEWWATPDEDPDHQRWYVKDTNLHLDYVPMNAGEVPPDLVFSNDGWLFPWDSRADVRRRVLARFEADLDAYLSQREARFKDLGMVPARELRKDEQFEWLARYQVAKMPYCKLLQLASATATRQAIRNSNLKLAAMLGLTLRSPDPSGRPKKRQRPTGPRSRSVVAKFSRPAPRAAMP